MQEKTPYCHCCGKENISFIGFFHDMKMYSCRDCGHTGYHPPPTTSYDFDNDWYPDVEI